MLTCTFITGDLNKDIVLQFDNNVKRSVVMPRSGVTFAVAKFNPRIPSQTMTATVKSVYTRGNNGFAEIRVYGSEGQGVGKTLFYLCHAE